MFCSVILNIQHAFIKQNRNELIDFILLYCSWIKPFQRLHSTVHSWIILWEGPSWGEILYFCIQVAGNTTWKLKHFKIFQSMFCIQISQVSKCFHTMPIICPKIIQLRANRAMYVEIVIFWNTHMPHWRNIIISPLFFSQKYVLVPTKNFN